MFNKPEQCQFITKVSRSTKLNSANLSLKPKLNKAERCQFVTKTSRSTKPSSINLSLKPHAQQS